MKFNILLPFTVILTAYIITVVATIEIMNYNAGGILPMKHEGSGGWREHIESPQIYIRAFESEVREELGLSPDSELPPEKQKEIESKANALAEEGKKANIFPRFIITYGFPLYLACPLAVILSIKLTLRETKTNIVFGRICLAISLISFILVLQRDYFGSIGI